MAVNIKSLETVKTLGGSTGAKLLEDKSNGRKYVLKRGDSKEHAQEEYTANKIYEALGVDIPETYLYQCDSGDFFLLHEYIESSENANQAMDEEMAKRVTTHFVADAILANWDVYKNDNILIGSEDGKLYRIDNGGALRFRAQGAPKRGFGADVTELDTLKDNNPYITSFLTTEDINNQIADVISKKEKALAVIKDDKLRKIMEDRFNYLEGSKMAKGGYLVRFEDDEQYVTEPFDSLEEAKDFYEFMREQKAYQRHKGIQLVRSKDRKILMGTEVLPQLDSRFSREFDRMAKGGELENKYGNRAELLEVRKMYSSERLQVISEDFNLLSEINKKEFGGQGLIEKYGTSSVYVLYEPIFFAKGGSLYSHGLEVGDKIVEDLGYTLLVQDKRGTMMYVDLSNGNRDTEPPLPFAKGGEVNVNQLKKLSNRKERYNYIQNLSKEELIAIADELYLDYEEYDDVEDRVLNSFDESLNSFAKGGEVILKDGDEGKKFDAKKYPAFLQDFDGDGIANIDDPNPLQEGDKDSIEQVKMEKVFKKLLAEKEKMKPKMYNLVGRIKDEVPSGSTILFRTKTPYSIINKLVDKRMTDPKKGLTDMIGTMVVVKDRKELDALNKRIKSGEFGEIIESDDYYKNPKGGYRAYHYIIMTDGSPAELQIKTKRQKLLNESSHVPYKQKELNAKRLGELSLLADKADRGIKGAIMQFDAVTEDSESLKKELTLKKKS